MDVINGLKVYSYATLLSSFGLDIYNELGM